METVLDLWHGRFAAAEARLFTVAAPIVARAHAERARVADTLQQTWQGQVFWLRREQGELLTRTDPEVYRQVEGHAFFAIWRVGLALASLDEDDLHGRRRCTCARWTRGTTASPRSRRTAGPCRSPRCSPRPAWR